MTETELSLRRKRNAVIWAVIVTVLIGALSLVLAKYSREPTKACEKYSTR